MKNRSLAFIVAVLSLFTLFVAGNKVLAAFDPLGDTCKDNPSATVCVDAQNAQGDTAQSNHIYGKNGIFTKGASIISIIVGIGSVIMLVVTGIKFITSGGNAQQVAGARRTALFAVVGVVVALIAQSIIIFVLNKL
jgi:hypothetical protein